MPSENPIATLLKDMSAPWDTSEQLDKLRAIYRNLQRLQTNIQNTQKSLKKGDLSHVDNHLALARSNAAEAKKDITDFARNRELALRSQNK